MLGYGKAIELNSSSLTTGTHFISLTATDSDGLKAIANTYFIAVPGQSRSLRVFSDNTTSTTLEFTETPTSLLT